MFQSELRFSVRKRVRDVSSCEPLALFCCVQTTEIQSIYRSETRRQLDFCFSEVSDSDVLPVRAPLDTLYYLCV